MSTVPLIIIGVILLISKREAPGWCAIRWISAQQAVHNTISHAPLDYRPLMDEVARRANGLLGGGPRWRLVIDDTGFAKKGNASVGVARQYNGRLGKIENCQIAVCTSLASGQQSTLTDVRLCLTEAWCEDPARCQKAGIPEDQRGQGQADEEEVRRCWNRASGKER